MTLNSHKPICAMRLPHAKITFHITLNISYNTQNKKYVYIVVDIQIDK